MATLATVALSCAIQIGRASADGTSILSLETQIKEQIGEAIRDYNRRPWALTEFYDLTITTVADQSAYASMTTASGGGEQTPAATVNVTDLISIADFRDVSGDRVDQVHFDEYKSLIDDAPSDGRQTKYARFGGRIWLYPIPNAAYSVTLSGYIKAPIPTADSDTSVWFDEEQELIEAAALKRVCVKYLRDNERAAVFAEVERGIERDLHEEFIRKRATGRIKPHE